MRDPFNDLRMRMKEALDNLWSRITGKFDTIHGRVDDVEGRMTTAEGQITGLNTRVGDLEDAVDDLDGAMIKTISLNGVNVPKDASGNVALQEADPTVPAWAKQTKAKTSDLTNDGDGSDNNSPFATQEYVRVNEVQVNGTALPIVNKAVDVPVPTLLSQLTNDVGFTKDSIVEVDYGGQYISEIYPYLIDKIGNEEIRRFRANILRIGLLTNHEINVDVWGFIYRWDENNADDDIWFTMVCYEEYSGNACYYARVYSNERDYQREIVHVDTVFQFGSGGGGSGAVDTVTFNGVTYQPDSNGNVSFGFTESDPTVPSWAKAAQKPTYTAAEVGAKPTQTAVADPTASGTAVAFIDSLTQDANGVITPTKKTVRSASQSESGLMSATDKAKLDGIEAGAQVNSITGVKGDAESSYRQGNVNLTPANIGALAREIDRATISDLNNTNLVGHAVLIDNPDYTGRGYAANLPPGMRTGYKWYDVYLFGFIQMAIAYTSEQGAFWVRTYTNGGWTSWQLIGGPSITGSVTSGGAGTLALNSIVRSGNVCTITAWMNMSATLPGTNGLFGTVPDGFRPSANRIVPCFVSSLGLMHMCRVQPNGEIRTATTSATYAASGYIYLSGSYNI